MIEYNVIVNGQFDVRDYRALKNGGYKNVLIMNRISFLIMNGGWLWFKPHRVVRLT